MEMLPHCASAESSLPTLVQDETVPDHLHQLLHRLEVRPPGGPAQVPAAVAEMETDDEIHIALALIEQLLRLAQAERVLAFRVALLMRGAVLALHTCVECLGDQAQAGQALDA